MNYTLIKNALIVNEGKQFHSDLLIKGERIEKIAPNITHPNAKEINAEGMMLLPGVIDDQVHFREPGLTYKANIYTESAAAAAGGVTSFMEMPNTKPAAITQEELEKKYQIAAQNSFVNYSFYMGASNDNLEEVLKTNSENVCGIKVFMGSSTGNMLVDNTKTLEALFSSTPMLIATHCEDENTVRKNIENAKQTLGQKATAELHHLLRTQEACYLSSSKAVELAKKHQTKLHILHISTAKEIELFTNKIPLEEKLITSEVCVHHLSFNNEDYSVFGNKIKCNPAIKTKNDQNKLWEALLNDTFDVIATDHAPHTLKEKHNHYFDAPSGLPLIQHTLQLMLEHYNNGKISLEHLVKKMSHNPATLFRIKERGFIREGYFADLVLVQKEKQTISPSNIKYKCSWSPLEGKVFNYKIKETFVNGFLVCLDGKSEKKTGKRLFFTQN